MDTETILQKLREEVALITRKAPENVDDSVPLRSCGIDSMSFLELLIFIKKEWDVDFLQMGLSVDFLKNLRGLAGRINEELSK